MGCEENNGGPGLFNVRTVRGEPYEVGGRNLTPVTRIVSLGKASATIRTHRYGGWAGGLAWASPIALIEETADGEREIAIRDETFAVLQRLALAAGSMIVFFATIRWLVRRRRRVHSA
jgi:uncharacterized spore protein YtfJ